MLVVYTACRNRICLAIAKFVIYVLVTVIFIAGAIMLLFIFNQESIWYIRATQTFWLLIMLGVFVAVCALPVIAVLVMMESNENLKIWNSLRQHYQTKNQPKLKWQDGNFFDVSSKSLLVTRIDLRVATTESGLRLAPAANLIVEIGSEPIGVIIFFPIWVFLTIRQVFFLLLFRPVEIPWSAIKSSGVTDGRCCLDIAETKYRLKISPKATEELMPVLLSKTAD